MYVHGPGTHLGKMSRSGLEVEPTGRSIEYRGMDVIPVRGPGRAEGRYPDGVTLLRQLGLTRI